MSTDRTLTCSDCGQEFTFTANEQAFYSERGFSDPRRCASCRASRKASRGTQGGGYSSGGGSGSYSGGGYASGGGYSSGGYSSGGSGYSGGRSSYGDRGSSSYSDRPPREMFEAVCSGCGGTARVPFRPTGGKPVYCTDCFAKRRAQG